jgi:putative N-acetyltransferase (TIGR04045 family)
VAAPRLSTPGSSPLLGPLRAGNRYGPPTTGRFLWDLGGPRPVDAPPDRRFLIEPAADRPTLAAYRALRRRTFADEQGLFDGDDHDELDDAPGTIVLVARTTGGAVVGGVRLAPVAGAELGWWAGSRLVAARGAPPRTGAALVRAACARVEAEGALRFDAVVQAGKERFFARLGWVAGRRVIHRGAPHVEMRWPIGRLAAQAATKRSIGDVLGSLRPGGDGYVGDDGAPVPGSDLVAATDAVLPSMVERDPWWAGWCSVLVNANDLAAMGATPVGLLDALAAPTQSLARRVLAGLVEASDRYGVPVLGGHTQIGVPAALSVTMLGRGPAGGPVPGGGGRPGDPVSVVADLAGGWRSGYGGRQWDSTTHRSAADLRRLGTTLPRMRPRAGAAKDISMAGLVGTVAMLAEASGCGAEIEVAAVPRPPGAGLADWLSCFPGFGLVVAGTAPTPAEAAPATVGRCGRLVTGAGVRLVWPDGEVTPAVDGAVLGLGPAATTTTAGDGGRGWR